MRVLITGASGTLGHAYALALLRAQSAVNQIDKLTILSRQPEPVAGLIELGAEHLAVDLQDQASIHAACQDVDVVVHCGGIAGLGGSPKRYAINVTGTQHVIEGCQAHGCQRLVHIGTPSIYVTPQHQNSIQESQPLPSKLDPYSQSKLQAERLVEAADDGALTTINLRPRFVFGVGEINLFERFIRRHVTKKLKRIGDGQNQVDFTSLPNMLHAIDRAILVERPAGQAFNISDGRPQNLWQAVDQVFAGLDLPALQQQAPKGIARMLATAIAWRYANGDAEPPMHPVGVDVVTTDFSLDITRAKTRLNYRPTDIFDETLRDYIDWRSQFPSDIDARSLKKHLWQWRQTIAEK